MTVVEEEWAAMEAVEAVGEDRGVGRSPETASEVTPGELPAEATPGEVPGPELTTGKSTEAADVASTEVSTTHVAAAEPTTPVATCQS